MNIENFSISNLFNSTNSSQNIANTQETTGNFAKSLKSASETTQKVESVQDVAEKINTFNSSSTPTDIVSALGLAGNVANFAESQANIQNQMGELGSGIATSFIESFTAPDETLQETSFVDTAINTAKQNPELVAMGVSSATGIPSSVTGAVAKTVSNNPEIIKDLSSQATQTITSSDMAKNMNLLDQDDKSKS